MHGMIRVPTFWLLLKDGVGLDVLRLLISECADRTRRSPCSVAMPAKVGVAYDAFVAPAARTAPVAAPKTAGAAPNAASEGAWAFRAMCGVGSFGPASLWLSLLYSFISWQHSCCCSASPPPFLALHMLVTSDRDVGPVMFLLT